MSGLKLKGKTINYWVLTKHYYTVKTNLYITASITTPTFSDDDRDSVSALQLPLIHYREGELVLADLQARHRGNSAVCILNLYINRTTGGATDSKKDHLLLKDRPNIVKSVILQTT